MGSFIAFAKRQGWPVLLIVAGVMTWAYATASGAYELWTLGLQPWALQLAGGLVVFTGMGAILYRMDALAHGLSRPVDKSPPVSPAEPEKRQEVPAPNAERAWGRPTPNLSLSQTVKRIQRSYWAQEHGASPEAAVRELLDKLAMGRLSAWGASEPNSHVGELNQNGWLTYGLDPATDTATLPEGGTAYHRVQFDSRQIYRLWPG